MDLVKPQVTDARIAQMMRVLEVLHDKGLTFADSLDVLRAIYGPLTPEEDN